jgi:hypothetical protein
MADEERRPEYLSRAEAAAYLKKNYGRGSASRLAKLASIGGGPRYALFGGRALYTKQWLDEWFAEKATVQVNTSEPSQTLWMGDAKSDDR